MSSAWFSGEKKAPLPHAFPGPVSGGSSWASESNLLQSLEATQDIAGIDVVHPPKANTIP